MLAFILVILIPAIVTTMLLLGWHRKIHLRARASTSARSELLLRAAFFAMGPVALTMLALSYAEVFPLDAAAGYFALPVYLAMIVLGFLFPRVGRRALVGFLAGFLATLAYDAVRLLLAYAHGAPDIVPHMGEHLTGEGAEWWVGYVWRLFGNGAGLGIAYAMLPVKWWHNIRGGIVYGMLVGLTMIGFLVVVPTAEEHLVVLSASSVIDGLAGHFAYGLVLGLLVKGRIDQQDPPRRAAHKKPKMFPDHPLGKKGD